MAVGKVNPGSCQVLVTGDAGYVGARLVPSLIEAGYRVRVLDTCWYATDVFGEFANNPMLELVVGDIRDRDTVNECTDVIQLACISNDPSYDLNPELGEEINFTAFESLVHVAKPLTAVGAPADITGFFWKPCRCSFRGGVREQDSYFRNFSKKTCRGVPQVDHLEN